MSLHSTLESLDSSSLGSPSSSQQQQIFVSTTRVKNQHLTLAQMRGVIQIFNHYFPKNQKKRLNKEEKNRRWISYKNRIYREYKRIITGKFSSEKALVKRYSEPLAFLKYKLKRNTNLQVTDLSKSDQDYFHEIGGVDDVNDLIKLTYNIDSVEKIAQNYQTTNSSRKRRRLNELSDSVTLMRNNSQNQNHNHNEILSSDAQDYERNITFPPSLQNPPQLQPLAEQLKFEENVENDPLPDALNILNEKLDVFEREQMDKKKIESFEISKQRLAALKSSIESQLIHDPHLIGCIPGVENQETLAFDCWVNKYKDIIANDVSIKDSIEIFIEQVTVLKSEVPEWMAFVNRWKLNRILFNDDFNKVWTKVKSDLGLQVAEHQPNVNSQNVNIAQHSDE